MVRPEPEDEQGLREALRKRGSVRVRGHDPADGEAVGSWLSTFHTVSEGAFSEVRKETCNKYRD